MRRVHGPAIATVGPDRGMTAVGSPPEALAVRIASALRLTHGEAALERATAHLAAARARSDVRAADLLLAVVVLVADRAGVFRRSRL